MTLKSFLFASLALIWATSSPLSADACEVRSDLGKPVNAGLLALAPGIFSGSVNCGSATTPVSIWTMSVDGNAELLGIRDDPLFRPPSGNPLTEFARIGYDRSARFTMFRRSQPANTAEGGQRRLFVTLCSDAKSPLNCSFGSRRVKMRIDLRDDDKDGNLDRAYHQISIYDGADRLQVVFVDFPHDARPHAMARQWIRFFQQTGLVDLDRAI